MSIQTLPNKGQIHLTTDNWSDFLNKNSNSKNKSGNVQSKDFDWMFFAGIANKEEFKKLKVSYSRASSFIEKMYDMEQQKLRKFIKQYEKNTENAYKSGVFGSPTFIYQGEVFWGDDRLEDCIKWINLK